ncbi:MAG TPA: Rieske 2Fe-2S domain-containing protein, partial [Pyrinomonadaceae bacterium]|nr:Rieske 2Fe-2S domain-containing protein [Pyrinomonadaceae bacterium]
MASKSDAPITRRAFCNRALLTSAALVVVTPELAARQGTQNLVAYPPLKIEGAQQVMPGSYLYFNYPKANNPAVLVRTVDGQYLAYSRKCAHLGCSVDYDTGRRCLICPCHRGVYDSRNGYTMY